MNTQFKVKIIGSAFLLFDADIFCSPTLQLFDTDYHTKQVSQQNILSSQSDTVASEGIGRAKVVYFSDEDKSFVLKHYYRGGLVASIVKDSYIGFDPDKTRAFQEFRLLKKMQELELPVPVAAAACAVKGLFSFRMDLITEEIKNVKTLADKLSGQPLTQDRWNSIGACIRLFHLHDIYHADLNTRNILLNDKDEIYIIDFDNSYFRRGENAWKMANLLRLKRSLLKFKENTDSFCFDEKNWSAFLAGYEQ
ncbi:MAG: 3-deoxy-D-manno-octulosonic acid kinase [Gammaproteobacteria bacterium]|nr:3-deoxy-D-manno-octulosonic acid kinase [Gammaproteobacteria bacterium]